MRMRLRSRRKQGEQRDSDEISKRGLRPANLRSTLEPRRVNEEDDGRDHHLAEPAHDEEQRRENETPEPELRQTHCRRKVEDVPGEPEDQRANQDHRGECNEGHRKPTGDKGADPKDAQHTANGRTHNVESMSYGCGRRWHRRPRLAAGAILTMLADTMMPEAYEHGGKRVGVVTTLGFATAFVIHSLD